MSRCSLCNDNPATQLCIVCDDIFCEGCVERHTRMFPAISVSDAIAANFVPLEEPKADA